MASRRAGGLMNQVQDRLGRLLLSQGKFAEAEPFLTAAVRLFPERSEGYTQLAFVLRGLKKFDEAAALLKQAIERDPNNVWLHKNLGWALWEYPKYAEAEQAFREAVRLDPGLANTQFGLGVACQAQRKFEESIGPLRIAIRLDPGDRNTLGALGGSLNELHQHAEAETVFRDVIRIAPMRGHHNLGLAFLARKSCWDKRRAQPQLDRHIAGRSDVLVDALVGGKVDEATVRAGEMVQREPDSDQWLGETPAISRGGTPPRPRQHWARPSG
jgi:tetratricopeptide (TPR) repeat protein